MKGALHQAIQEVLACPRCRAALTMEPAQSAVRCLGCHRRYPVVDEILVFLDEQARMAQEEERTFRDAVAVAHRSGDPQTLLEAIGRHHAVPLMRRRAQAFRAQFAQEDWLLDLGMGWGWHWTEGSPDAARARIIGVDLSLEGLRLARTLLGRQEQRVVLVCADAAALPIRDRCLAGVWSVQAFQHFPAGVLIAVQAELDRVLQERFVAQVIQSHAPWCYTLLSRVAHRRFHREGKRGALMVTNRTARAWEALWREFRGGRCRLQLGFSELFFHPELRLRWARRYPVRLEQALARRAPRLAALVARQVEVRIESV